MIPLAASRLISKSTMGNPRASDKQHQLGLKCFECNKGRSTSLSAALVVCDECDRAFHIECHAPLLARGARLPQCFRCHQDRSSRRGAETGLTPPAKKVRQDPLLSKPPRRTPESLYPRSRKLRRSGGEVLKLDAAEDTGRGKERRASCTTVNLSGKDRGKLGVGLQLQINSSKRTSLESLSRCISPPSSTRRKRITTTSDRFDGAGTPNTLSDLKRRGTSRVNEATTPEAISRGGDSLASSVESDSDGLQCPGTVILSYNSSTPGTSIAGSDSEYHPYQSQKSSQDTPSTGLFAPGADATHFTLPRLQIDSLDHQPQAMHPATQIWNHDLGSTVTEYGSAEYSGSVGSASTRGQGYLAPAKTTMSLSPDLTPYDPQDSRGGLSGHHEQLPVQGILLRNQQISALPPLQEQGVDLHKRKRGDSESTHGDRKRCKECDLKRDVAEKYQRENKLRISRHIEGEERLKKSHEVAIKQLKTTKDTEIARLKFDLEQEQKKTSELRKKSADRKIASDLVPKQLKLTEADLDKERKLNSETRKQLEAACRALGCEPTEADTGSLIATVRKHILAVQSGKAELSATLAEKEATEIELQAEVAKLSEQLLDERERQSSTVESLRPVQACKDMDTPDEGPGPTQPTGSHKQHESRPLGTSIHPMARMNLMELPLAEVEAALWGTEPNRQGNIRMKETFSVVTGHRVNRDPEEMHVDPLQLSRRRVARPDLARARRVTFLDTDSSDAETDNSGSKSGSNTRNDKNSHRLTFDGTMSSSTTSSETADELLESSAECAEGLLKLFGLDPHARPVLKADGNELAMRAGTSVTRSRAARQRNVYVVGR